MNKLAFFKALFFVLFLLLSLNNSWAQAAPELTGSVKTEAEEPIIGATVMLLQNGEILKAQATDINGDFAFKLKNSKELSLKVTFIGFETFEKPLNFGQQKQLSLDVKLKESWLALSPLQIIGGGEDNFKRIPGKAFKLKNKTLELINPIGTQEILDFVPGITAYADDGFSNSRLSIGIRGLNPRRSSRVLVLEDGIPIQPAVYIYPNMYYNPPVERLDEIEVIKGSAAIQYGPQTMGGVINYVTRRPRQEFGGMAKLSVGTYGYTSLYTEVGGWGNDDFLPEVQLLVKRGDGFRDNNDFQQFNGTFKAETKVGEGKSLYFKYNTNYEFSHATYTGLTEWSFENTPNFNPKKHDEFEVLRNALDVVYQNKVNDRLVTTLKTYGSVFQRYWWRENDMFIRARDLDNWMAGETVTPQSYLSNTDLVRVGNGDSNFGVLREFYVAGVEKSYDFKHELFGLNASLNAGARYHLEYFKDDFKLGDSPTDREGAFYKLKNPEEPDVIENREALLGAKSLRVYSTAGSAYFQENINFNDNLSVRLGLRLEAFEQEVIDRLRGSAYTDHFEMVVLPGIGFNYEFSDYNIFGGVHRGFTPPTSSALNLPFIATTEQQPGIDLMSEKSWNYELGFRGGKPNFGFEFAAFYVDISNIITAARSTALLELGNISMYGAELGTQWKMSKSVSWLPDLHLSYTWLQSQINDGILNSHLSAYVGEKQPVDVSGNILPYAPEHTLNVGLGRTFDFGLALRADFKFVDQVFTDYENLTQQDVAERTFTDHGGNEREYLGRRGDAGPVPAYYLIDLSAEYKFNDHWKFSTNVKNLLDEIYIGSRLHSHPSKPTANGSSGILIGPRRQINLTVNYQF